MKTKLLTLLAVGVAAGSLTSCVDTYNAGPDYGHGGGGGYSRPGPPPVYRPGYVVERLPSQYETVNISGTRYYRYNDVYYRPQGRGYVVVDAPRHAPPPPRPGPGRPDWDRYNDNRGSWSGSGRGQDWDRGHDHNPGRGNDWRPGPSQPSGPITMKSLPKGYQKVNIRGENYFLSNGVYYQVHDGRYVPVRPR